MSDEPASLLGLATGCRYRFWCVGETAPYVGNVVYVVTTRHDVPVAVHLNGGHVLNWSNIVSYVPAAAS